MSALARITDPETSHAAASSVTNVRQVQRFILAALSGGSMTDEQVARWFDAMDITVSDSGLRTRRAELVRMGLVVDTGQRERLASGRRGIVWGLVRR